MYSIYDIVKVRHDDGSLEIKVSDTTIELIAVELCRMGLSPPISISDEESVLDHFDDMDIEIGQVESEGIYPTRKYSEQVCRAVDEFNFQDDGEYIDYDDVNARVEAVLKGIEEGTYDRHVKIRWRKEKAQNGA